jgi:hypothetical protein
VVVESRIGGETSCPIVLPVKHIRQKARPQKRTALRAIVIVLAREVEMNVLA